MSELPHDPVGAFCTGNHVAIKGAPDGPLSGLTMGVKDLFDVAGHRTGFGNPTWLATHEPAAQTARVVQNLADAGADMIGKTQCDELCFSLYGENAHYGTPVNVNAPGRIPGGSSSGSAAAVAADLVDFALGSDTGGSVRLPASYCGLYGIRTTHGRVPVHGVAPLAHSFDTVGWLARDGALLNRLGPYFLGDFSPAAAVPTQLLVLQDGFELAGDEVSAALAPAVAKLETVIGPARVVTIGTDKIKQMVLDLRVMQGAQVWQNHGNWVRETRPKFGPGLAERMEWTATITPGELEAPRARRESWLQEARELLPPGTVICLPTAPGPAPRRGEMAGGLEGYRERLFQLLCLAGLGALPQINLPLATVDGAPLGLGVMAGPGGDETLLALAAKISEQA